MAKLDTHFYNIYLRDTKREFAAVLSVHNKSLLLFQKSSNFRIHKSARFTRTLPGTDVAGE
jgi:hypothetical protein